MGTSFHGSLAGKPGKGLIGQGLCVEEGSGMGVSPYKGPVGGPGEGGGPFTRNFESWMKGALGIRRLYLKRLTAKGLQGGLLYWVPWVMKGSGDGQFSSGGLSWAT